MHPVILLLLRSITTDWVWFLIFTRFLDHTHNDAPQSVGLRWTSDQLVVKTSTDNTHTHNRQTSMTPVGFEPKISAGERPQTYALDRAATGPAFE